uniref:Putative ovule protein n=1 Tax=Solanum chacoense TaxID=4108 RepID=A0A0V0GTQ4_SOLCH
MIYNPKDDWIRYSEITCYNAFYEAYIFIESLVWPISTKPRMQQQPRLENLDEDNRVISNLEVNADVTNI